MYNNPLLHLCCKRNDYLVQAAVAGWRALWVTAMLTDSLPRHGNQERVLSVGALERSILVELTHSACQLRGLPPDELQKIASGVFAKLRDGFSGEMIVPDRLFGVFEFAVEVVDSAVELSDVKYLAARELRRRNRLILSHSTVQSVRAYTSALRSWISSLRPETLSQHYGVFLLKSQLETPTSPDSLTPDSFFELVSALGWVRPAAGFPGEVTMELDRFDSEAFMGQYFGLPTSIPGFDSLFAGAGPLIVDAPEIGAEVDLQTSPTPQPIGGRTILLTGPYGTGKSTLTLQVAIEVARKGGAAVYAAMEQTAEECRYAIEALGLSGRNEHFHTVDAVRDALPQMAQPYDGRGILAFLPIRTSCTERSQQDYGKFLDELRGRFSWLAGYPLRMLIVDPVNAVSGEVSDDNGERRRRLVMLFQAAKVAGINLWLTRERNKLAKKGATFEENVADTVLHLSIENARSPRRTIEVRKSRLQREEAGLHTLVLQQDNGLRIYPSPGAIARSVFRTRQKTESTIPIRIGVTGIDDIFGKDGVLRGDVIAFDGAPGSSRTLVAAQFLLGWDRSRQEAYSSLFVSDAPEAKMRSLIDLASLSYRGAADLKCRTVEGQVTPKHVRYHPILAGAAETGQILQEIDDHFRNARCAGQPIDRVVICDLSRWQIAMPLLKRESSFGPALIGIVRSWGATCVFLADYVTGDQTSILTDLIVNNADCVLQFERLEFRGQVRQFVRVVKSHNMAHRRDAFELIVDSTGVRVESYGALLRKNADGDVTAVKVRLFLHADSPHHQRFNNRLEGAIRTSLADTILEDQNSHYDPEMFRLSASSAVDEVQVLQLDEFQLPDPDEPDVSRRFALLREESINAPNLAGEYVSRLAKRVQTSDGRACIAVPFYQNISLLAIHEDRLTEAASFNHSPKKASDLDHLSGRDCWEWMRERAIKWEERGPEYVYFSCPLAQRETVETYNSLFFEMLQAYGGQPPTTDGKKCGCSLYSWLSSESAKATARSFRDICHRSHRHELDFFRDANQGRMRTLRTFTRGNPDSGEFGPVVWRHWYNTLSQMMWDLPDSERSRITVRTLFDKVTTAGEWYLVVPAYSAAPELAWQIIGTLTAPDRELERVYRGVGLPTRESYYSQPSKDLGSSPVSPFFLLNRHDLRDIVNHAFQRSQFPCYQRLSDTISAHLQRILELPPQTDSLYQRVDTIIDHLLESISYIQGGVGCGRCGALPTQRKALIEP